MVTVWSIRSGSERSLGVWDVGWWTSCRGGPVECPWSLDETGLNLELSQEVESFTVVVGRPISSSLDPQKELSRGDSLMVQSNHRWRDVNEMTNLFTGESVISLSED